MEKYARIMLVEDSISDQVMIERALEDDKVLCDLTIVSNGKEAIDALKLGASKNQLPDLILLDMNMPIMDGKQTLQEIRASFALKHLPVVMLTTSSRDKDVLESYRLGVNAYLTKPVLDSEFINMIRQLEKFWFDIVLLPKKT